MKFPAPARRIARGLVLLVCTIGSAQASPAAPLDLSAAIRYALAHQPAVLQSRADVVGAKAALAAARAGELPVISGLLQNQLSRSENAQGQFAQFGISPAAQFSQNTAELEASWTIFGGGHERLAIREAQRQLDRALAEERRQEQQTITGVSSAYFAVVERREVTANDALDTKYQQQVLQAAQIRERNGTVAGVDVLKARVALGRAQVALNTAQASEADARESLALQVGAPLDTGFALPAALPQPPPPREKLETFEQLARTRPDVLAAKDDLDEALLARADVETPLLPQLTAGAALGNQFSPTLFGSQLANYQAELATGVLPQICASAAPPAQCGAPVRGSPGFWQLSLTSSITLPIVDYGRQHTLRTKARVAIDAAVSAYRAAEDAADVDVRRAYRDVRVQAENVAVAAENARLAEQSAHVVVLQYRAGRATETDVEATEQTASQSRNDLADARARYLNALVDLRRASGTLDAEMPASLLR